MHTHTHAPVPTDKAVLIRFVNDTPTAREDTIYAEFTTDPAVDQVSCTLLPRGSAKQKNCESRISHKNPPTLHYRHCMKCLSEMLETLL